MRQHIRLFALSLLFCWLSLAASVALYPASEDEHFEYWWQPTIPTDLLRQIYEWPKDRIEGIVVFVAPKMPLTADAYSVTLKFKRDGKTFVRVQVVPIGYPNRAVSSLFAVGFPVEPIEIRATPIRWNDVELPE